jgi:hypothetical protein
MAQDAPASPPLFAQGSAKEPRATPKEKKNRLHIGGNNHYAVYSLLTRHIEMCSQQPL